jgi:drug/metabolite transporter (DMT)-like permease
MKNWPFYAAGVAWSSIFGLSFLVTKGGLEAFSPFELLFLRFALATFAMTVLLRFGFASVSFRGKPKLPLILTCLFQPMIYFICETFGLRETASSTAGLILGALPAVVAALSAGTLGERLSRLQTAGLCLSVAGVALIVVAGSRGGGARDSLRGVLLIVGALASAGLYNVFSRKASSRYTPVETTFAMMASGALFFGILALVDRRIQGGSGILARATPAAWGAVAYLGLLSSVLAFFLVNLTLSRLKASQSSVFGTITTLVALGAGVAFRGESFGPIQAAGALMILAGVWGTNWARVAGAKGKGGPEASLDPRR